MKTTYRAGHYYHLYNRGVNRSAIFFQPENWTFFLQRIRRYFRPDLATILAYCLMPTHYHLLVHLKTDHLGTKIMQPFGTSYTKAINVQQDRVGPLFQGPFRGRLVDSDRYLRHLTRYIHRNPVDAGHVQAPQHWAYSSYREYAGLRNGTLPQPDFVLAQFPSREAYRAFVEGDDTYVEGDIQRWLDSLPG